MDMKRSILKHTPSTLCITNSTVAYSCVNAVTFCPQNFLRRSGVTKMLAQMQRWNQVRTWPFPAQWKLDVHEKLPPPASALTLKNLTSSLTSTNYEGVGPPVQVGHLSPSCRFICWLIHSCCRLGLSTVPHTMRTYGAVNTVPVPVPVTSEPCSDHTCRNLWRVPYGTILFTAVTGGIWWIQCHHSTMKTRIKWMIRILPVLYGHGQIRNTIEACMPSDFQVLHIYLIPHTPRAQVCFTGDCDTTYDVTPYSPQG